MAVHTDSTLTVHYRPHSELDFGVTTGDNIITSFSNKFRTTMFNICFYSVGLIFAVGASTVLLRLAE